MNLLFIFRAAVSAVLMLCTGHLSMAVFNHVDLKKPVSAVAVTV
jgi:hypothetical protein